MKNALTLNVSMKVNPGIKSILLVTVSLVYFGCGSGSMPNAPASAEVIESSTVMTKEVAGLSNSTDSLERDKQTRLYGQAIEAYIKAVYRKDKSQYDTLFFGKHEDFHNITLPGKVLQTEVVLLTTEEADERRKHNPGMVYINLFGEITTSNAHFIFVTFFPGYQHQYDYFFDFYCSTKSSEFMLDKIQFEDYAGRKSEKPERVVLFDKGKHAD